MAENTPSGDGQAPATPSTEGAAPAAPAEGQATPAAFIDVDGQQLPLSEAQNLIRQGRNLSQLQQQNLELQKKLESYKWADPLAEEYSTNPEFAEGLEQLPWRGGRSPLSQEQQRLDQIERQNAQLQNQLEIMSLRNSGMKIGSEDERKILYTMATNPGMNAQAAYLMNFAERDRKAAVDAARAEVASKMAESQDAYEAPPSGQTPKNTPNTSDWTPKQHEEAAFDRIKKLWSKGAI